MLAKDHNHPLNNATPIKCLDLNHTSGCLKLEGLLYIVFIFCFIFNEEAPFHRYFRERNYHIIGNLGKEAQLYWLLERGGTILLGEEVGRFLLTFVQNYAGCWLTFHIVVYALPGGLVN